jgi:hypothetical protein
VITLSKSISDMVKSILSRRAEVKEEYIKAWLAVNIKDESQMDYIINNCRIVEKQWHEGHILHTSYHLEIKNDHNTSRNT